MIVDPSTGHGPLFDREGLLLVRGPNRMLGYLENPDLFKSGELLRVATLGASSSRAPTAGAKGHAQTQG